MTRALSLIVAAILLSQPGMTRAAATSYARVVQQEALEHHVDPFTLVAMAHFESHWIARVSNNKCFGLMGVCLSTFAVCRRDPAGVDCEAKRAELLDGHANLRMAASAITANRRFCRAKTGRAGFHHWLASYQGLNRGGVWCGQRKVRGRWQDVPVHRITRRVIERRAMLARRFDGSL